MSISQFQARVDRLVSENNLEGLEDLHTKLVILHDQRRMRFERTKDKGSEKLYIALGQQIPIVADAIKKLKNSEPLDEEGIASKLGNMAVQGVKNARDRVLHSALGSDSARARLDLNLVTRKLNKDWKYFSTRKATAFQDKRILKTPLIGDLQKFLASMYGWRLQAHQIKLILTGQGKSEEGSLPAPTKPPVVDEPNSNQSEKPVAKTADDIAREALKNTSPEEYAALKKKFGKPTISTNTPAPSKNNEDDIKSKLRAKMNQDMANESVIFEDYDDQELNEPFDLKSFQRLADVMLDLGFFKIDRNGENTGGKDGSVGSDDSGGSDGRETVNARVTPDGHSIDINKMNKMMEADGIDAQKLASLKNIALNGKVQDVMYDKQASRTMASLVNALLNSIDSDNDRAARSITAEGSTIDINAFKLNMEKLNVSGKQLNQIRQTLGSGGEQAIVTMLMKSGENSDTLFNLTKAALMSIKKAAPVKKKA
jgi:hypothetical protein